MKRIYEDRAFGPEPNAGNFWLATLGEVQVDPPAEGEISCDFAIVGAGFTGLNAALELAASGADVVILEAEHAAWGASGRNGGFCCIGGDKLATSTMIRKFGNEETRIYHRAQRCAIDMVADLLDRYEIDADRHSEGETMLAHRPSDAARLSDAAEALESAHGVSAKIIRRDELAEHGLSGPGFFGALHSPLGFALNPAKYAAGLAAAARRSGVRIYAKSPVTSVAPVGNGWRLATGRARVSAAKLLIATNGYSSENIPRWMAGRYLPVQSSIMVTRPLSDAEISDQGFSSRQMCYDSRKLLHYFRLLPDSRFLFGMRGAIRADENAHRWLERRLRQDFEAMFPHWVGVETTNFWSGLACLSRSRTPFAGSLGDLPNAFGAFAYHGNGVAMGSYCGRLMADHALGRRSARPAPSFMSRQPRRFELGRFRRAILRGAYAWYSVADR